MTNTSKYDLVIGAGPVGLTVARELERRGRVVKIGTRTGTGSETTRTYLRLDLQSPIINAGELAGAQTLFVCSAPAYWLWQQELVPMLTNALTLARELDVPLVFADNLYAYGRARMPMTETSPYKPHGVKGNARQQAAELLLTEHQSGRVKTAIVRASDFYGPGVARSMLALNVFKDIVAGRRVERLGNIDVAHSFTFIDDFARSMVNVALNPDCYGQVWHAATPPAVSMREMVKLIAQASGMAAPKFRVAPKWLFFMFGMFDRSMKELREVYYQNSEPFVVDSSKYRLRFNEDATPLDQAIRQTLASVTTNPSTK